ncbi:hypothetical protein [Streptomyces sp. ME19-01-6]|uniref:hypothetical protein n=1 Tax=Streptomyces sp. ME19-01-6 TaxID=3028686 RepID=UPI0029B6004C|nr:hypothetical protein [Streptomyces sp. ME19-01-6]MDX3232905.1 hypothetical protein [Streptomyces sp. ME19-01-6]
MSDAEQREPNVTYTAPVGSIDLPAFDEEGVAYEIVACDECLPWYAEVVVTDGGILVREWHAVDCPAFESLLTGD